MQQQPAQLALVAALAVVTLGSAPGARAAGAGTEGAQDAPAIGARYIVKYREGRGPQATAALHAAGAQVALALPRHRAAAAYLPEAALAGLRHNPNIEYVEADVKRYPFGVGETSPFGIAMVQADQVSDASAASVTLCIIDSGYDLGHPDLPTTNVSGTNLPGSGNWYEDTCGHGSHVAGTIAALGGNAAGVVGVNPSGNLDLHIIKVFDGVDCGWAYSSSLVAALDKCEAAGADVVSMSLGGSFASSTESSAFQAAYDRGVLSFAAAGNGGNKRTSYPAGYASVISVAAVDEAGAKGDFSQFNADVEIAAPGVDVLSTVPYAGPNHRVATSIGNFQGKLLDGGAATGGVTGPLADGGLCDTTPVPGVYAGQVVLCARGGVSFAEKAAHAAQGGGIAAVVYNNAPGLFDGTLNGGSPIPAIALRQADGQALQALVGQSVTVTSNAADPAFPYDFYNGTSMATPHASAVAALVWSNARDRSHTELRAALNASAFDLGAGGRDKSFGYGLIQARAALDLLSGAPPPPGCEPTAEVCSDGQDNDCDELVDANDPDCATGGSCDLGGKGDACTDASDCCSGSCGGKPGRRTCK